MVENQNRLGLAESQRCPQSPRTGLEAVIMELEGVAPVAVGHVKTSLVLPVHQETDTRNWMASDNGWILRHSYTPAARLRRSD